MPSRALALVLLASACGGAQSEAPVNRPREAAPDAGTVSAPSAASLVIGHWTGELAGGPLVATAEYRFSPDGTYTMTGYPSIGERGRFTIVRTNDASLTLHLRGRMRCGPCEGPGPSEPADDRDEPATLSADGQALTWRGWTFTRAAE